MADDADLTADRELRLLAGGATPEPAREPITFFSCNLGRRVELPQVQVMATFVDLWIALASPGWEKVAEREGKVVLEWRGRGEPVRPGRGGSR